MDLTTTYQHRQQQFSQQAIDSKGRSNTLALARLGVFLAALVGVWVLWNEGAGAVAVIILLAVVPFFWLMKQQAKADAQFQYFKQLSDINASEIKAAMGDFSSLATGKEYLDPAHPYALDLDLFGEGTLYQWLNRTVCPQGSDTLAAWLSYPTLDAATILQRQEALRELAPLLDVRQDFQAYGMLSPEKATARQQLNQWLQEPEWFLKRIDVRVLTIIGPLAVLGGIVASVMGYLSPEIAAGIFFAMLGYAGIYFKKVNVLMEQVSGRHDLLKKYARLLDIIEKQSFNSPLLKELQQKIAQGKEPASAYFRSLSRITDSLESRRNLPGYLVTNGLLQWDLQNALRLERWKKQHRSALSQWFEVAGTFDALLSLANLHYNKPNFTFPTLEPTDFHLHATDLGHPLLNDDERVTNNLSVPSSGYIILVTGANMAGKSTFLRAVGINLVLACAGSPVCANEVHFLPIEIHPRLRTTDSLQKHESYFFAELKRLQGIVRDLEAGKKRFILLDEILKGTNSTDQHLGSEALIERLLSLGASGMVATHDLELGVLQERHVGRVRNQCFEIEINGGEMKFDYKLRDGLTQNFNASLLMKNMGIV
ncbi:MutS family DNA mismatch repair protein [soil metagenome]